MPRLLVIFLLLCVPFQSVWAVAAVYCQHEQAAVPHFGHHAHEHAAGQGDDGDGGGTGLQPHADCSVCHLGCAGLVDSMLAAPCAAAPADPPAHEAAPLPAVVPDTPERPRWARLA